jgi:ABC-type tungstate transport system permease subunit
MDFKEKCERYACSDPRVYNAIQNAKKHDKSFTDRGLFKMFPPKYEQSRVREIWFQAMALGMQEGLRMGSLEGQRIDISTGCKNERHKEFYEKHLKLAQEYNCAIAYHPMEGMCVMDLNTN